MSSMVYISDYIKLAPSRYKNIIFFDFLTLQQTKNNLAMPIWHLAYNRLNFTDGSQSIRELLIWSPTYKLHLSYPQRLKCTFKWSLEPSRPYLPSTKWALLSNSSFLFFPMALKVLAKCQVGPQYTNRVFYQSKHHTPLIFSICKTPRIQMKTLTQSWPPLPIATTPHHVLHLQLLGHHTRSSLPICISHHARSLAF